MPARVHPAWFVVLALPLLDGCGPSTRAVSVGHSANGAEQADSTQVAETAQLDPATLTPVDAGLLVLLITLDTTRADHLGCYGYDRPTSPSIDELAAESVVYERAIAPGTWTLTSHASLFTGKLVSSHGARLDPQGPLSHSMGLGNAGGFSAIRASTIGPQEQTLAAILQSSGYATAGIVGGPWMKTVFGLNKGFEHYDQDKIRADTGRDGADITSQALTWLALPEPRPRFLFLNYFDAHSPFTPPPEYAGRFVPPGESVPDGLRELTDEQRVALYDAEILYMDAQLGRLFDGLKRLEIYDDAWIIVTADHGDLHGEHGVYEHGRAPFQEVVHVPLIIKHPQPDAPNGREAAWVQLTDVMPTLLKELDLSAPSGVQGEVLSEVGHPIVIESHTIPGNATMYGNEPGDWLSLIERDGKKVVWNSEGHHKLFDLAADPDEQRNLMNENPELFMTLTGKLQTYLAEIPQPEESAEPAQIDPETLKALKSLGYVE